MPRRYVLAIDQGTTGSTAMVFDDAGAVRGRGYSEFTQYYPRPAGSSTTRRRSGPSA